MPPGCGFLQVLHTVSSLWTRSQSVCGKELTMYANLTNSYSGDLHSENTWKDLYPVLRSLARYLVYSAHVLSWRGQEEDIIEDVVQETARRLLQRAQKAERGEATSIESLPQMMA